MSSSSLFKGDWELFITASWIPMLSSLKVMQQGANIEIFSKYGNSPFLTLRPYHYKMICDLKCTPIVKYLFSSNDQGHYLHNFISN